MTKEERSVQTDGERREKKIRVRDFEGEIVLNWVGGGQR